MDSGHLWIPATPPKRVAGQQVAIFLNALLNLKLCTHSIRMCSRSYPIYSCDSSFSNRSRDSSLILFTSANLQF